MSDRLEHDKTAKVIYRAMIYSKKERRHVPKLTVNHVVIRKGKPDQHPDSINEVLLIY